jgi:hypothetical protein
MNNTETLLRQILSRHPKASLVHIRRAHPAFRAMSFDQLGLRVSQVLDRAHGEFAK